MDGFGILSKYFDKPGMTVAIPRNVTSGQLRIDRDRKDRFFQFRILICPLQEDYSHPPPRAGHARPPEVHRAASGVSASSASAARSSADQGKRTGSFQNEQTHLARDDMLRIIEG
jgi:hypothetical protein